MNSKYKVLGECIDLIIDNRGKTPKKMGGDWSTEGVRTISAKNVHGGKLDNLDSIRFVSEEVYKKWMKEDIKRGDCLLASEGATLGENLYWNSDEKVVIGQRLYCIRTNNNILYSKYFAAYMNTHEYQKEIEGKATGTSVLGIKQTDLLKTKVLIKDIEEQRFIGDLYFEINEKIETNNKINKKLEEMAQAIFKQWFVEFEFPNEEGKPYKSSGGEMVESELGMIPKGWSYTNIENVVSSANTGADAIRRAPIVDYDTGIKCVRVGDMSNKRDISSWAYCEVNDEDYKKFSLKKNDILVTRTATIGLNTFIFEDLKAVYNNGLIRLKVKEDFNPIYIYQVMNHKDFMEHISKITGETSTRPNMKINYLLKYKFILPEKDIRDKFEKIINPILNKINSNNHENEKLAISRDTLLPKLMSGEIRVPID